MSSPFFQALRDRLRYLTGFCFSAIHWHSRAVIWCAGFVMFVALSAAATLQWWVFPRLDEYRPIIAAKLSDRIGRKVVIESMHGGWHQFRPWVELSGFSLFGADNRPAIRLAQAEATLAIWPLFIGEFRFDSLTAINPDIELSRGKNGKLSLAGIVLDSSGSDSRLADWLLKQHALGVRDGRVVWHDDMRTAPPLILDKVNISVENLLFGRHTVELRGSPPPALASSFMLDGSWSGDDVGQAARWKGKAHIALAHVDLAGWGQWLAYPVEVLAGHGALDLSLAIADGKLTSVDSMLDIDKWQVRIAPELAPLSLRRFGGNLHWRTVADNHTLTIGNISIATDKSAVFSGGNVNVEYNRKGGKLTIDKVVFPHLEGLDVALPIPADLRRAVAGFQPAGKIEQFRANWTGEWRQPASYAASVSFSGLALSAPSPWPSAGPMDGTVSVTDQGGQFNLTAKDFGLSVPGVFVDPTHFDSLATSGSWQRVPVLQVKVDTLSLKNADMEAHARGSWSAAPGGAGTIDLTAEVPSVNAVHLTSYLPMGIGSETRAYLQHALKSGDAKHGRFVLHGPLDKFPFVDEKDGQWLAEADVSHVLYEYVPGWPAISNANGKLRFSGNRMEINASGDISGTHIQQATAVIADLSKSDLLTVEGTVTGDTPDFLRFIANSPLDKALSGLGRDSNTSGKGDLALKLDIPLADGNATRVDGHYRFNRNHIQLTKDMPDLWEAKGDVHFTEHGVDARAITANGLGGRIRADLTTAKDGTVRLAAAGNADVHQVTARYEIPFSQNFSGTIDYQVELGIPPGGGWQLAVMSPLRDAVINLPEPMKKPAGQVRLLKLGLEEQSGGQTQRWRMTMGDAFSFDIYRHKVHNLWSTDHGEVRIGNGLANPARSGLWVNIGMPELALDPWLDSLASAPGTPGGAIAADNILAGIQAHVSRLTSFGQVLNDVTARIKPGSGGWQIAVGSKELEGNAIWNTAGSGRLAVRLSRLTLPIESVATTPGKLSEGAQKLPAVDIKIEDLQVQGRSLGHLAFKAAQQHDNWQIDRAELEGPNGKFSAGGQWKIGGAENRTAVNFSIESTNLGKLLEQLGYEETLKGGTGKLTGDVSWPGSPVALSYATMGGNIKVLAENGQFAKIPAGGARLLGILSLQSLPRRLTFDFHDVFSEGFAFNRIEGDSEIMHGVMSTDNLQITGPGAKVQFVGDTDLAAETVRLRAKIIPTFTDSVAVGTGVALANPVIGLGAYLLQRVLKDPIGQIVSYEIDITGKWDDPKEEPAHGKFITGEK